MWRTAARPWGGPACVLACLAVLSACIRVPAVVPPSAGPTSSASRVLVVALDAVPYDAVVEFIGEGPERLFPQLGEPVPVVSSFPSTTTLAFTGMFDLGTPPGYEAKFFDRARGRVRGGGLVSYGRIEFSWREFFDWKTDGALRKAVGYARPARFSQAEFRRGVRAFLESDASLFTMYVGATDGVAHLLGPEGFRDVLADLDAVLEEARGVEPDFRTVLVSDHGVGGGEPLRNVRRDVVRTVEDAGFSVGSSLRGREDAVFVPFGLLSSFVAFTAPERTEKLLRAVAGVPGVALCAARAPEETQPSGRGGVAFLVAAARGEALLERRGAGAQRSWRLRTTAGTAPLPDIEEGVWRSDADVLRATAAGRFPDAAHRIAGAFELVEHEASVVCSVAPGFMYGAALTEISGRVGVGPLRWTHGALERADSLGFVMTDLVKSSDLLGEAGVARFDEVVAVLGLKELLQKAGSID